MKESALNRNKIEFSEQGLEKMKKASKPIIVYNIENNTVYGEYNSIVDAAVSLNCNIKTRSKRI